MKQSLFLNLICGCCIIRVVNIKLKVFIVPGFEIRCLNCIKLWSEFWNYGPIICIGTRFLPATLQCIGYVYTKWGFILLLLKSCQYSYDNDYCVSYIKCVFNKQWYVLAHSLGCVWETVINVNHRITIRCFVPLFLPRNFVYP